jgi:hypothetical protein
MHEAPAGRVRSALVAAALFLATAAFTLWQNTRVAVLWDLSYLLDTSFRISLYQLPYRDFPFAHAPLTFLLHAALIHLFGRVVLPHMLCAVLEAGLATLLAWRILLHLLNPLTGRVFLIATLLAAPLIFLGIYGVYPHPIYDSDCILAVLLALVLLLRANQSMPRNALAGAACVLPLFLKQNIGLPFLLTTLATVAILAIARRMAHDTPVPQLSFLAGAAAVLAAALLLIHATVGLHNYIYWTIAFAAQRRLPGLGVILDIFRQSSLLWTIPAALLGVALLRVDKLRLTRWCRITALLLLAAPFLWTIASLALASDSEDRAAQLLSLWPYLLLLAAVLAIANLRPRIWRKDSTLTPFLPLILLAAIYGTFLSQQIWGSTYAIWPLLMLLIASLLTQVPILARPLAVVIAATFLLCGGLYAASHERLNYIQLDGPQSYATLPALRGLTTPGPWLPGFEELVRITNAEIPPNDAILLIPGDVPFYFATGRTPQFPVLLFDPATNPYTPQQVLDQVRICNVRWLIVSRNMQLSGPPSPDLPEILRTLQPAFIPYRTLTNYDIYRRK